jgi:hypothetical protein
MDCKNAIPNTKMNGQKKNLVGHPAFVHEEWMAGQLLCSSAEQT